MPDTSPEAIRAHIAQGDSQRVELKQHVPKHLQLERLLSAFANTEGGIAIFGVKDNGQICGIAQEQIGTALQKLQAVATKLFDWPIEIGVVEIEGSSLVYAVVDPAPHALAPIKIDDGRVFFRVGAFVQAPTHAHVANYYGRLLAANAKSPPSLGTGPLVFLSYAKEDLRAVQQIYIRLKLAGLSPWMDKPPPPHELEGIPFGADWDQVLKDKIKRAAVVLAFLSRTSVEKMGYVQREFRSALSLQAQRPSSSVYLVPTLLEQCDPPAYTVENISFSDLQWYKLYEEGDATLIRYLRSLLLPTTEQSERTVAESYGISVYSLRQRQAPHSEA